MSPFKIFLEDWTLEFSLEQEWRQLPYYMQHWCERDPEGRQLLLKDAWQLTSGLPNYGRYTQLSSPEVWSLIHACVAIIPALSGGKCADCLRSSTSGEDLLAKFGLLLAHHAHVTDSDRACCFAWFVCQDKVLLIQVLPRWWSKHLPS